jgi:N-acetylmuramoyl-L-alanine amidase
MRSFARTAVLVLVASAPVVHAQTSATSQPKKLYDDALVRERILRQELQRARTEEAQSALLLRVRALTGAYDDMSRLFATSGFADNALWQGAVLSADAFWEFGDAVDRATALRLFAALASRFPSSSLAPKVTSHTKRLQEAKPAATIPRRAEALASAEASLGAEARSAKAAASTARPPVTQSSTPPPPTGPAALPSALTSITREVLPEVLRIVIQLGKEVPFYDERIGGPPRVFLDLRNTRAIEPLKDAVIPFPDDVVKQVRIGRQPNQRTRVVLDLKGDAGRYSVYTLYDPYRIVVDFERKRAMAPAGEAKASPTPAPPPPAPEPEVKVIETAAPATVAAAEPETTPAAPPLPPSANVNGGFSMSRQLGLGVARIVIDAGHGGHDPGAKARGIEEAELVLDVALRLEALLKGAGVEVIMTRRTDTFIALEERTAIANRVGADLFLSIHSNASASESARGVETYFLNFAANPEAEAVAARENAGGARTMRNLPDIVRAIALNNKLDESRDFASMVQNSLYTKLQKTNKSVRNLGVKQAPFMVLVGATMPSILAEISFITNRQEATLLKTDKYKQQIAEALLGGVLRYQQALKKVPAIAATK